MKNIISKIMILLVAAVATVGCTPMVKDYFDETSTERMENYTNNIKDILTAAPNGWRAEYYASTTYGGYNVFMKFEKDSVAIASEKVGPSQGAGLDENGNLIIEKSHIKFEQSMGVVLSIDVNNSVFHYFAEPKNPDGFGDSGDGMAGDFEFRVVSASADSVVFEGKKHQTHIVLLPVPADRTWKQEYEAVKSVESNMSARTYYIFNGAQDMGITVTTSYRRLVLSYLDEEGVENTVAAPFIITGDGYKFYRPFTLKDIRFEGFYNGEDGVYHGFNNPELTLQAQTLPLIEQLSTGMWFITYDDLGAFAKPYWDTFKTALEKAGPNQSKATLYWALIGKYSGKTGYHMNAGGDQATIGFDMSSVDGDDTRVKLKYKSSDTNKAGTSFYDKFKLKEALIPFIGKTKTSSRTFKITTDNNRRPTYFILTDESEPSNVIKLWAEERYYPFGDEEIE